MTTDRNRALESRFKETEEENELLLMQLHQLQEELEQLYLRNQSFDGGGSVGLPAVVSAGTGWVDDELPEILAENQRLRALAEAQKKIHRLQSQNALNARLGDILIQGVSSPASLVAVPFKLGKIWLGSMRRTPPRSLGGKDFSKVIAAYRDGGFAAVDKLMNATSLLPAIRADGYKALATQLRESDRAKAAEAARRAFALSPTRFRLKWLAFRLRDAGDVVEAEALLDILPPDTPFNDSDERQASRLRDEAKQARQREAKQKSKFSERRADFERRFNDLATKLGTELKLADARSREIGQLRQEKAKLAETRDREIAALRQERARMAEARDREVAALRQEASELAAERDREIDALRRENADLAQARKREVEALQNASAELAEARDREIEVLRQQNTALAEARDREAEALRQEKDQAVEALRQEKTRLAAERDHEIATLQQQKAKLDEDHKREVAALQQQKANLNEERKREVGTLQREKAELAEARDREVAALRQEKAKLAEERGSLLQEKANLAEARDREVGALQAEKAKLIEARDREVAALQQERVKLAEAWNQEIAVLRQEKAKLAEEHGKEVASLQQAKAKLLEEHGKEIAAIRQEMASLTEERISEIATLREDMKKLEKERMILKRRNQISSAGIINKGDTDIDDLIADMDLFFYGRAIIYVDVGAYAGSIFQKIKQAAKRFRIHEAHLYEPNPVSYAQLSGKAGTKDGPIVHTYNLAVSNSTDDKLFIPAKTMTRVLSSVDAQAANIPSDAFAAHCVTLDSQSSVFTEGKIDLLKIDVEGKELDVLASAHQLLSSQAVNMLYIEVGFNRSGTQQTYFPDIDAFLQPLGYRVLRVYEQKEEWMSGSPLLRRANIAYMSEKFANAHPLKLMQELQVLRDRVEELTGTPQ